MLYIVGSAIGASRRIQKQYEINDDWNGLVVVKVNSEDLHQASINRQLRHKKCKGCGYGWELCVVADGYD